MPVWKTLRDFASPRVNLQTRNKNGTTGSKRRRRTTSAAISTRRTRPSAWHSCCASAPSSTPLRHRRRRRGRRRRRCDSPGSRPRRCTFFSPATTRACCAPRSCPNLSAPTGWLESSKPKVSLSCLVFYEFDCVVLLKNQFSGMFFPYYAIFSFLLSLD